MRKIEAKDTLIKVEREDARSLEELMEAAGYMIYNGCMAYDIEELTNDFVELIDYLVARLEHADSERFK